MFGLRVALLSLASICATHGIDLKNLFRYVGGQKLVGAAKATRCTRIQNGETCKFDTKALKFDEDESIQISLEEKGREIVCHRKRTNRKRNWYGECDGDAQDANFVTRTDADGNERTFGSIRIGNEICHMAPNADGEDEMNCRPDSEFKEQELRLHSTRALTSEEVLQDANYIFGYTPSEDRRKQTRSLRGTRHEDRFLLDSTGSTVDMMVVWTSEAECANSNQSKGCALTPTTESNMRGLIQLAIAESNTAFELSGVNMQLRLVHAYREHHYIEPVTGDIFSTMLNVLRSQTDGALDGVHAKRALYGADMVHMIVASPNSCGHSFTGHPESANMFSISKYSCATGYYSLVHEAVHNMNGLHDSGTHNSCRTQSAYNYGYRDPKAAFRSIMAYECVVGQCDNVVAASCPRVQRFSNPKIQYNGKAIGSKNQDNARQINDMRELVASFFPSMNCMSDSECNDQDPSTTDTCNLANAACVFTTGAMPVTGDPAVPTLPIAPGLDPVTIPVSYMEALVLPKVTSSTWSTVWLGAEFVSPIPVCTVQYDTGSRMLPAVARMRNVGPTSFDIRLQNPSGRNVTARDVHCVVVEEGIWKMEDGRAVEARQYSSTVTDRKLSWTGQRQAYSKPFSAPVVLGQVMSHNDAKFSVFWSRGLSATSGPDSDTIFTGKHVGEDRRRTRASESVGYIVFETGHASSDNVELETGRGQQTAKGYVHGKYTHTFDAPFATAPLVAVVSQVAMDESDGSWAVLTSSPTTTHFGVALDEDMIGDFERKHGAEELDYAVFSTTGSIRLYPHDA